MISFAPKGLSPKFRRVIYPSTGEPAFPRSHSGKRMAKITLVDDDENIVASISLALESHGTR